MAEERAAVGPYQHVITRVEDGIGTLLLNRPARLNAFDGVMREELVRAARELVEHPGVRVMVVTGSGRAFCAGADVRYMEDALSREDFESAMALVHSGGELVRLLRQAPQPVLASLNGAAAGGGANLALACDLRIASENASIGQVFHRIGLHPDMGGTYFLPRLIGPSRALELIWSTDMVPAARCLELGLVNRVVPADRLSEETARWATRLAALPPLAVRLVKQAVYHGERSDLATALEREAEHQLICFRSEDATEGLAAFANKRDPVFHGR
ncbi:MAG: 2-(1,2-epoxy-1,2-dihydrophenyl)acetyl-CoA isomerase [Gemmatimonadales bacterium]|nr:2-(1,2-epoxy-1,2-dihydrophenyl)acetyl-CoA isomerase [Gemmatimonadales bacterium]